MSLYSISFHGSEESKKVLLNGPVLSTSIQDIFEAFMEPAAERCLKKFKEHKIEILPEDIFDEAIDMLTESGFQRAEEKSAVVVGNKINHDDFSKTLGNLLEPLIEYNKKCQSEFLKEVYEQVERSMGQKGEDDFPTQRQDQLVGDLVHC